MSDFSNDPAKQASAVSAALTELMLHLNNRFQEERLKLEERTFRPFAEDAGELEEG